MNQIIHSENGKRAVVIASNDETGPFRANLYVNCNPMFRAHNGLGDITMVAKNAKRLDTLRQWAAKQVA